MKEGDKYQPLFEYLYANEWDEVSLTFAEIETLLGRTLPNSAKTTRAWWSNRNKGGLQASAWIEAGYRIVDLNTSAMNVTFRKSHLKYNVQRKNEVVMWNGTLIRALRQHMKLTQSQLAKDLGVRQQTISEWESEIYRPKRAMLKYLTLIAERADFKYGERD